MEAPTLVLALAAAILGALLVVFLARRGDAGAALAARLEQLAAQQSAAQAQMGDRLQAQERTLGQALDKRLGEISDRLALGLEKTTKETQNAMGEVKTRLAVIDAAQKNIAELSTQVVSLQDILSNKQARGAFGEIQLKDLVEAILPPDAYAFQAPLGAGKRVDCLLKLPNPPGPIAVDAKFPLEAYHALRAAKDDAGRQQAARAFAQAVRTHIADIAGKYIVPGETAESALMFLPSEAVYAELHANFPPVIEESYRKRVFIVSPTTLWATLNTLRAVLKDVRMREQAGVIQREVGTLVADVARLDDRVGKLQRHLGQADEDMRDIRVSSEKIAKRGERIKDVELERDEEAVALAAPPVRRVAQGGEGEG